MPGRCHIRLMGAGASDGFQFFRVAAGVTSAVIIATLWLMYVIAGATQRFTKAPLSLFQRRIIAAPALLLLFFNLLAAMSCRAYVAANPGAVLARYKGNEAFS